ncbi:MAG: HAMP domain-containing histidine kinase [Sulfurimonas sp.]|uniref:sensor histidine kinase n=1 Tax=Sulfurimonas sp. TaxID=2022749 RepID=UPI0025D65926|nr:HAMP domain-containing sensor histidine kinase [Sulfurimonas sp.]MCK9491471.1 HAMP domain-containing histidine kinase [Sulfurimonas sp.]
MRKLFILSSLILIAHSYETEYEPSIAHSSNFQLLFIAFVVITLFLYSNFKMRRLNKELKEKMQEELKKSADKDRILFHQNKVSSMGEMLENIAHQWRQPLSQINSNVLLIDDVMSEQNIKSKEIEDRLLEIESLTKYLSNTIDDFKGFFSTSRDKKEFFVKEMIEKSLYIVKGSLARNDINVEMKIDNKYRCNSYENELQQVIVVILNNAIDAIVERHIFNAQIIILYIRNEDSCTIRICDNAGGITKSIKEKIFEPYFTTKHKSQGTGLGLYMSRKIIEDILEGELSVSNCELGVCFDIRLGLSSE